MSVKKIREIPSTLPHARLYLDDIQEISEILLEAYRPIEERNGAPRVVYEIGNLEMDSIEDLTKHGGHTSQFRLKVMSGKDTWGWERQFAQLRFYDVLDPELSLYHLDDEKRWSVYSRVKAIFDGRRMVLKQAIRSLPSSTKTTLYFVLVLGIPTLINVALWKQGLRVFLPILAFYYVLLALLAVSFIRKSRVILVDSRQRWKTSVESRQRYIRDVLLLITGGIITFVVELIIAKLRK